MTGPRVVLAIVSVNKVIKKLAKGVKGYLQLRIIVKFQQVLSSALFLLGPPGRLLGGYGGGSGLLGGFMIILGFPEVRFGL